MKSLIIIGIAAVVIGAVAYGFFSKLAELKSVWKTLRDQFGVSEKIFPVKNPNKSILGKLRLMDQEFVGGVDIVCDGILFRHEFVNHYELIHFPKERIRDLVVSRDRASASFSIARDVGLGVSVQIPWSPEMSDKWERVVNNDIGES